MEQLDFKGSGNEFNKDITKTVVKAVSENKPINLISFTCSTINSRYLFSNTPWLYVSENPKGNNLTLDIIRLGEIVRQLRLIYPKVNLNILIGNTDPYYIYLQQFKDFSSKKDLLWNKFCNRWEKYKKRFEIWVKESVPGLGIQVISWYDFEKKIENETGKSFENEYVKIRKDISSYFKQSQLDWELRKLSTQFGKGTYFKDLEKPKDSLLKDWIIRKFAEYALQGAWIYENIPNAILIQNEKPSDLRSQMYQPVIKKRYRDSLPIAYFLGVDNVGYQ